jgi:hypothetical protein
MPGNVGKNHLGESCTANLSLSCRNTSFVWNRFEPKPGAMVRLTTIDGNWSGCREILGDRGIAFSENTISDFQGNVSGGERRAFAAANASLLAADVNFTELAGIE